MNVRTQSWFAIMVAVLVLDAIAVTWFTAFHMANAQVPLPSESSGVLGPDAPERNVGANIDTRQTAPRSDLNENRGETKDDPQENSLPAPSTDKPVSIDDVKIDVQPPQFPAPIPGEGLHLPAVPSLTAPQLPQSAISDAVRDEMRKMISERSSEASFWPSADTPIETRESQPPVGTATFESIESLDRRFEIVQYLSASARLMLQESRSQALGGNLEAAKTAREMSRQLRSLMTQVLQQPPATLAQDRR